MMSLWPSRGGPAHPRRPAPRRSATLQWHVTDRCNLRCTHCYHERYDGPEMSLDELVDVIDQFQELLELPRFKGPGRKGRGHINVTGGEPLVRDDILELLEVLHCEREWLTYGLLTNGSLIDREMAARLTRLDPSMVQVSVEGSPETHDSIRGKGSHHRTMEAIGNLAREGLFTVVSFTAHGGNFRQFPAVVSAAAAAGAHKVWTDRLVPLGSGGDLADMLLTPEETRELFTIVRRTQEIRSRKRKGTVVPLDRGLQFLVGSGRPYRCSAGDTLVSVMPDGDLYPCRRMPIKVGNLRKARLREIYLGSGLMRDLRDRDRVSEGCEGCNFSRICGGGSRCLSSAVTGDPFKADPGCWLAFSGTEPSMGCLEIFEIDTDALTIDENCEG